MSYSQEIGTSLSSSNSQDTANPRGTPDAGATPAESHFVEVSGVRQCSRIDPRTMKQCERPGLWRDHVNLPACAIHAMPCARHDWHRAGIGTAMLADGRTHFSRTKTSIDKYACRRCPATQMRRSDTGVVV